VRAAAELGFRGLKLHPNSQEFDILAPLALEAYAAAEELDLLLTFHTGVHYYRIREYAVTKFDEVARQFPNLRFSMEHMGGYHFFNEALAVLLNNFPPPWVTAKKCNIFAGLVSVFTLHKNRFWYLSPQQIMEIILQSSIDQVIFGLDFPYNLERETQIGLDTIRSLNLTDANRDKILGNNLRRELGLPMQQ
jgi:predicted TIM-barrel fold metal-dependent hydrolase